MKLEKIRSTYIDLKKKNDEHLSGLKKKQLIISFFRLLDFVGGGLLTAVIYTNSVIWGSVSLLFILSIFVYLIIIYEEYSEKITFVQNLIRINSDEIAALGGDYSAFNGGVDLIDIKHDFSNDIDLFGGDSLFSYLNRTVTDTGRSHLAQWLCEPYDLKEEIINRQEAVRELSVKLEWRQQFAAYGIERPLGDKELKSLKDWLKDGDIFNFSPLLKSIAIIFPAAAIITLIAFIISILPFSVFLIVFLLNLLIIAIYLKKINRIHAMVSRKHLFLSSVALLIRSFENEKFSSHTLTGIQEKLCTSSGSAAAKIKELDMIIRSFDNRLNMILGIVLNGLLLWDYHCIMKLERWRRAAASHLPGWLTLLGTIDALNSLANYAYNNPDYCYPLIAGDGSVIDSVSMGHPLLRREIRVSNDFSIQKRGLVYIITGANMAGKSTFLRTVAVNILLAMVGAPVCCQRMKFSPVRLFTSMRTIDSLSHNESYFYAELKRLKILKDRIEQKEDILFILDEILKGTNSTDKSIGSKQFLRLLIGLGGTGLVATHDISLGEMQSEYSGTVINKCFEIEIDSDRITFDYLLRNGITRKMNAAMLMKQMGIV